MSAGRFPVFQHRGGTPPITIRKILNCLADLPWEGVPIGADRDPSLEANSTDKSKPCFRSVWGPTSLPIYRHAINGHHDILVREGALQSIFSVRRKINAVPARLQTIHQLLGGLCIVFDHENMTRADH
jgi:hypothetical protein